MRTLFLISLFFLFSCQQEEVKQPETVLTTTVEEAIELFEFDSLKAVEYGADEYGMKRYVMAFLKKGPNRDLDSAAAYDLQAAHLANIDKMAEAGKLVLAGPFFGNDDIRGIYIFNVETIDEAKALTETDPAIQAGSLVMELTPWYGSAALMEVGAIHKTLAKQNI